MSPVHTDEDTSSFVREQKQLQYGDLKRALIVMGRIEHPSIGTNSRGSHRRRTVIGHSLLVTNTASPSSQSRSLSTASYPKNSPASNLFSLQPHQMLSSTVQHPSTSLKADSSNSGESTVTGYRPASPVSLKCSLLPEHIVLVYLLENNRLLLSSVNQMRLEAQVCLKSSSPVLDVSGNFFHFR